MAVSLEPGVKRVIPVDANGAALTGLATDHGVAEDAAHVSGDVGFMSLGVRKDVPAATAGTAGDYQPPIFDALGKHWVNPEKTGNYELVAASATTQALGATGATGDYLEGVLIVPETVAAGTVAIKDGAGTAINIFVAGTLSDLKPFYVTLGMISGSGAWQITTGANVHAIGIGRFT